LSLKTAFCLKLNLRKTNAETLRKGLFWSLYHRSSRTRPVDNNP
jgi:hypothetical protein